MIITKLSAINFRNYSRFNLNLSPKMNIFVGDNAAGKTNILESVVILSLTKTYRNGIDGDVIRFGKQKTKLKAVVKNYKKAKDLTVEIFNNSKIVQINGKHISRIADYISNLNVVIFTPDDLDIIKGSPSIRRNLLNLELSQICKKYLVITNEYNKLLKTRNEYLKILFTNNIADKNYLDILTDKLIEKAIYIYQMRSEYLKKINNQINDIFYKITGVKGLSISYTPNIKIHDYSEVELKKVLENTYKKNYHKELMAGMTLYGPHRDDFSFFLNEKDIKVYASQGQQKSAILSYKLATIPIFEEFTNTKPVILLDDIFSELDNKKKNRILKYINQDIQSIITTTDLKNISKKMLTEAAIFTVKNGTVERS